MANPEHLKKLKEGVEFWNTWREEIPGTPDLSGADLGDVNLMDANLSWTQLTRANLSEANLCGADLNDADLCAANLSGSILVATQLFRTNLKDADLKDADLRAANLTHAKLCRADLQGANLKYAGLTKSDLSIADISGANLTGANLHNWNIKGIKCTHIIWNDKEIHYDNPDDFEKAFTQIGNVVEILLNLPFSGISHLVGRNLEKEINKKYGDGTAIFKGQTAISDSETKFEFLSDPEKFSLINDKLSEIQKKLNPVLEDFKNKAEPQSAIEFRDEVGWKDLMSLDLVVLKPKEISRKLKERFARLHPLLQNIYDTIENYFKNRKD